MLVSKIPLEVAPVAHAEGTVSVLSADARRMAQENLITILVMSSGDSAQDLEEIAALSEFAESSFDYYELIVAAMMPGADWTRAMRETGTRFPSFRVIVIDRPLSFEEATPELLENTIGDYVLCLQPGEIDLDEFRALVERLATGDVDLVRAVHARSKVPVAERGVAALMGGLIHLTTGHRLLGFQARAFGVTRTAVTRLLTVGGTLRFFRLVDAKGHVIDAEVDIATPRRRRLFAAMSEKLRVSADLISLSARRLIRSFAFAALSLSLLSLLVCAGSFAIWLVKPDVAPGWTSLTMLFSLLFAANFGVLSAMCLGLNLMLTNRESQKLDLVTTDISGGDFYRKSSRLNVEVTRKDM